ncbi:MAG: PhoH family protein, partial [Methylocystaceae bacterium]
MTTIDDPLLAARGPEPVDPEAEITLAFENNRHASLV